MVHIGCVYGTCTIRVDGDLGNYKHTPFCERIKHTVSIVHSKGMKARRLHGAGPSYGTQVAFVMEIDSCPPSHHLEFFYFATCLK